MSADLEYASVQRFEAPDKGSEHYLRRGGAVAERDVAIPETHLRFVPTGGARLYGVVRVAVRILVRMLYFSPIVLVPKIALFAADSWYSDVITLAFVLLVVTLFGMVSLLVLLHLVVGPRSVRRAKSRVAFEAPRGREALLHERTAPDVLARLTEADASTEICLSGRIDAGGGALPGEAVLHERWDEEPMTRTLWSKRFAVMREGQPPIIVDFEAAPTVLGPYQPDPGEPPPRGVAQALRALGLGGSDPGAPSCTLRHGDEIELAGWKIVAVNDVHDVPLGDRTLRLTSGEGGPYRGGEAVPGLLLKSTPADPIVLRRVG